MGDEDLRARFGMLPSTSEAGKDGGLGLSGVGTTGVRADVLGNIEHDRFASAGKHDSGEITAGQGHSKNASFGSLLGGILANGGIKEEPFAAAAGAPVKEEKMVAEEDEEL